MSQARQAAAESLLGFGADFADRRKALVDFDPTAPARRKEDSEMQNKLIRQFLKTKDSRYAETPPPVSAFGEFA